MAFNISALKLPVIRRGYRGSAVVAWQGFLKDLDYPVGAVDGDFGPKSDAATRSYQRRNRLAADGIVGNMTYGRAINQGFLFRVPNLSARMLLDYLRFPETAVKDLQLSLNAVATLSPSLAVDGDFGPRSTAGLAEAYKKRDVRLRGELGEALSASTKRSLGQDFEPALNIFNAYAKRLRFRLSGSHWYQYFPTSRSLAALASPFREKVQAFQKALIDGGAQTIVAATYRPPQRAYLMHYAARIDRGRIAPENVPSRSGVDIQWVHYTRARSLQAAAQMVDTYGIGGNPVALESLHTRSLAIDWNITWEGTLNVKDARGRTIAIGEPRNGANNSKLFDVGASYGVYKLTIDPPHWSYNGR
ncbi:MAG: peptidoglycan-binding domain-containing protein [Cyanobacteriota bacterium]|nr:peptidoglycan-binding domain-containing protein [Cyanobacteriota bacterium]